MAFRVIEVEARPASSLAGAGKSLWIPCRGASQVVFRVSATDAGTLSAFGSEMTCNNPGSTLPTPAQNGSSVGAATFAAAVGTLTSVAMDASVPRGAPLYVITPSGTAPAFIPYDYVRVSYTPTSTVAGFRVMAEVYYPDETAMRFNAVPPTVGYGTST